jgi:hypothetical protein
VALRDRARSTVFGGCRDNAFAEDGVGPTGNEAQPSVKTDDNLCSDPGDRFDLVVTKNNPPFGKKSSVMVVNAQGEQAHEGVGSGQ